MINKIIRFLFFFLIVRPLILVIIGLNVRHRERLPKNGPAIVVANHNSHLDTFVLMTLLPFRLLSRLHPVAAADYFLKNRLLAWFSCKIIGIIPIQRSGITAKSDPLAGCSEALERGEILILYPEGSRGEPERMSNFKSGIAHLSKRYPDVPIYPVFLHGLGRALPKDEAILVPFFCDVFVGASMRWTGDRERFMELLAEKMKLLSDEGKFPSWE